MSDSRKTAEALEKLVAKAIDNLQAELDVLGLPPALREPMWTAVAWRAVAKAVECVEQTK